MFDLIANIGQKIELELHSLKKKLPEKAIEHIE